MEKFDKSFSSSRKQWEVPLCHRGVAIEASNNKYRLG